MAHSSKFIPGSTAEVLFCDFDGPIVNVADRYYHTYRLGLRMLSATSPSGQAQETPEQAGEQMLTLTPLSQAQFWHMKQNRVCDRTIATQSGVPAAQIDDYLQRVCRIVNHPHLLRWDRLQVGADAALAQLKRSGLRVVLVTLRHPRQVQSFLQAHDLSQYIDQIFGALDPGAAHANRADQKVSLLKQAIAEQTALGYSTQQTWMIGDTEADILAGQAAGISTMALTCGVRSHSYLENFSPTQLQPNLLSAVSQVRQPLLQAA
ncbi:MAG: HAD family hydrolase [Cyanobacteria bacterium J06632_22]